MTHKTEAEKNIELIKQLGFNTEKHHYFGKTFNKQNRHVWPIKSGWQTADLIDGFYKNHEPFSNLKDALNRSITD